MNPTMDPTRANTSSNRCGPSAWAKDLDKNCLSVVSYNTGRTWSQERQQAITRLVEERSANILVVIETAQDAKRMQRFACYELEPQGVWALAACAPARTTRSGRYTGGIAVFVRTDQVRHEDLKAEMSRACLVRIDVRASGSELLLAAVYGVSGADQEARKRAESEAMLKLLETKMLRAQRRTETMLIVGDLNGTWRPGDRSTSAT